MTHKGKVIYRVGGGDSLVKQILFNPLIISEILGICLHTDILPGPQGCCLLRLQSHTSSLGKNIVCYVDQIRSQLEKDS